MICQYDLPVGTPGDPVTARAKAIGAVNASARAAVDASMAAFVILISCWITFSNSESL
jgi:hypothetical protein